MSTWDGVAEAYRRSFATMCEGTVPRLLSDTPEGHHLDVGSGTGALAAAAAARGRTVAAVDADPQMVALSSDLSPGAVLRAALPDLPFGDGAFDAVTANFVVNHVADPRAAVSELARVTRPGGRVALTIWTSGTPQWARLVADAFSAAGVVSLPGQRLSPELDFARSVEGLRGLASSADLAPVVATELRMPWTIAREALWRGIAGGVGVAGRTLLAQTPGVRAAAEARFREATEPLSVDGVLTLQTSAAYVVAEA
ncbi:class I SAM-dependent methyltransferase [Terrabacter sp. 2RAF25]|uniref:class I SAM-dependent methyltransferase n=1 Tax=Terrabacter sp. 2RAF25 TaxID=3232998 RepID=UPI003F9E66E0